MRFLLPVVLLVLVLDAVADGEESKQPVVYKNWPACKKGQEYVEVIKKEDRQKGEIYHEKRNPNGFIKTYLCQPCTQCASGVLELKPCSVHSDTECSSTKCTVEGCILDDTFHACRLPGDINEFESISEMMDPCDPNKARIESKPTKDSLTEAQLFDPSSPKENDREGNTPREPQATDSPKVRLGDLAIALVIAVAILAAILLIILIIFLFRHDRKREKVTAERQEASSMENNDSITPTPV